MPKIMSKNAEHAYKMEQFTLSDITDSYLSKYGFHYHKDFFIWLCRKGYIKPIAFHHAGEKYKMKRFYSPRTIPYVVENYNLSLLYRIFCNELTKEKAKEMLGVHYLNIELNSRFMGIKSSGTIKLDVIKYNDILFMSHKKALLLENKQYHILAEYTVRPNDVTKWNNPYAKQIIRKILIYKEETLLYQFFRKNKSRRS